jgi:hypothetical protein
MLKIREKSSTAEMPLNNQRLNANAGLTQEESDTLRDAADQLVSISKSLSMLIGSQLSDPTYVDGKNAAADRLLDWTADIFALSEDIKFYLNPPPKE